MSMKKFGAWEQVEGLIGKLSKTFKDAQQETLKKVGLFAEGKAKKHMSAQDLGWIPLKPETLKNKQRNNHSTNTLVMTSAYFQSITSWVQGDRAYAGVKKVVRNDQGEEIANIAKIHEFGSRKAGIPARPLWQPVFKEALEWLDNNSPEELVIKKLRKLIR